MRYSDINNNNKKGCNSTRPKAPCLEVHSCLWACFALLRFNRSLSRGCSCGSTSALVQTLPISEVSRLRTPSCLCATKPPLLHDRAWQTVYFSPQTHLLGKSDRGILYLKRRESLNSCLFSTKPWSTRGTAVSHELAPLSLDWLTDRSRSESRVESVISSLDFTYSVFNAWCCLFNFSVEFSPATMNLLCVVIYNLRAVLLLT